MWGGGGGGGAWGLYFRKQGFRLEGLGFRVEGSRVEGLGLSGFVEVRALTFVVLCIWGFGCRV